MPQSKGNDLPDNNGTHSRAIADAVKLPRYQRSKELKKTPETSDSTTELTGREARSKVLKSKDDTTHFNQRLQADNEQRKQNKQDLDKELR